MSYLPIVLSGMMGTTAMILVMSLINRLGLANADMLRAIGSIFTRSTKDALLPGVLVHYAMGCAIAFAYTLLIGLVPTIASGSHAIFFISTMVGLIHGIVVGLLLMIEVAEHHPVKNFQEAGVDVAVAHVVGHVVYGFFVGLSLVLTRSRLDLISDPLQTANEFMQFGVTWFFLFGAPVIFLAYLFYSFHQSRGSEQPEKEPESDSIKKVA